MDAFVPADWRGVAAGKRSALKPLRRHARLLGSRSLSSDNLTPCEARPFTLRSSPAARSNGSTLSAFGEGQPVASRRAVCVPALSAGEAAWLQRPAGFTASEALKYSTSRRPTVHLLDTGCRVNIELTHSKQTIVVPVTRHRNRGAPHTSARDFQPEK